MNPMITEQLKKAHAYHMAGKLAEAEMLYNSILNLDMQNGRILYLLANIYSQRGYNGLAVNLLTNSLDVEPEFQAAWIDLGVSLRKENQDDLARVAWERAQALGDNPEIDSNMATLYADSGEPEKALEYCNKAIRQMESMSSPDYSNVMASARWNKALAMLSLGKWKNGWKEHNQRRNLDTWNDRDKIHAPLWDGKPVNRLYLHGEQGKGDEIMYLSMLKDVLPLAKHIVIEANESVSELINLLNLPTVTTVNGQDEAAHMVFDAKIAMGDLGQHFRRDPKDFPGTPYLKADPERVEHYRNKLQELGPGPYVGIAWLGGTKSTRIHKRSVGLGKWGKLLDGITAVSLQYGEFNEAEATKHNIPILGDASTGKNLAEQAALIEACDYVVTVAQTVVHLAGALGKKCYVMVCDAPSWRYGVKTDKMPWYSSVKLIRQKQGESWDNVIERTAHIVHEENPAAEQERAA